MIAVVTGQVGVDKKPFLEEVVRLAARRGKKVKLLTLGDLMYAEAPDVQPGRILDLPLSRLTSLRRSALKDVCREAEKADHLILNTHATFRWRHGLFAGLDHDEMLELKPDCYISLVENVDAVHARLLEEHDVGHCLKDLLVWREEEILATEMMASATIGFGRSYVMARGQGPRTAEMMYRLLFCPEMTKVYLSFPMTHVGRYPGIVEELDHFRSALSEGFITFDPGDLDEKRLHIQALAAAEEGESRVEVEVLGRRLEFDTQEVLSVAADIHGQIYARDFKLIDQSDMIVSFVPALPDGGALISSGVERELQHAHEATRQVVVLWTPKVPLSPFVEQTANHIFSGLDDALAHFASTGLIHHYQPHLFE